ncbi:MAG: hypothetical protein QXQ57_00420 [Sulfolobales archaeon]
MEKLLKTLRRTVVLEAWTNRFGREALREISEAYRTMSQRHIPPLEIHLVGGLLRGIPPL